MKKQLILLISLIILLLFVKCEWPFDTDISGEEVFKLSIHHNIERIMPSALITISWDEITAESFSRYQIEKRHILDNTWTVIDKIYDPFQLSYTDILTDDDDLYYRVGLFTEDNNIIWASTFVDLPNTNNVIVPEEFGIIQEAINSPLVDNGDVIIVKPGTYEESILILGKDIIIRTEMGRDSTIIDANNSYNVIVMNNSKIDGFTITGGLAYRELGGGVLVIGNGTVQNCLVKGNIADSKGGGIYIDGNGKVYNTIVTNNFAPSGSGIYNKDNQSELINNTLFNNDIVIEGDCDGLILRNNIIYQSGANISFVDTLSQNGVIIDYSLLDNQISSVSEIIVSDPQFEDYTHFNLSPNSPCIDAGHPDSQYNDQNGTRNDMGAYGGPKRT